MKSAYDVVLFDIDGTLLNTGLSIIKSIAHVLKENGITPPENDKCSGFVGPPIREGLSKLCGLKPSQCDKIAKQYRAYYEENLWTQNYAYPGVYNLLDKLKRHDTFIAIASSRPYTPGIRIARKRGFTEIFDYISLPDDTSPGILKSELINRAIEEYAKSNNKPLKKVNAIMIGDTIYDMRGAYESKIDSVFVTYGFGKRENLGRYKPTFFANSVGDLEPILFNYN